MAVVEVRPRGTRLPVENVPRLNLCFFHTPGSVYEVPLNPAQASAVRDAFAQAIYNNLFEWIVQRVNVSMKAKGATSTIIGVLDIYGFEIFDTNQFEQLCINYVNEKLQQIFIQRTLKTEQEEYVREQIKVRSLVLPLPSLVRSLTRVERAVDTDRVLQQQDRL